MQDIFKDKNEKERDSVTDKLITKISQLLKLVSIIAAHAVKL